MSQPPYMPASPYPAEGDVLDGKYRVDRFLGEGGMGAVAKATHLIRRAPVALKFMSGAVLALPGAVERFVNEGVAASQIDSDHVVKVFDVGRLSSGAPYLVMEYLDGADLAQIMAQQRRTMTVPRAMHFALQILRGLQNAHASGIVHRDMKPSNCFVIDKDDEPDFVKLVDFGISKVRSGDSEGKPANLTRTNSALGTPLYMSPEQARSPRDVDHRADLYSVGAIIYEMLTGRTPYTAASGEYTEILYKIFTTEPQPLGDLRPDVPEGLCAAVTRALARDPGQRFGSALEMAEALAPFADERSAALVMRLPGAARGRPTAEPDTAAARVPDVAEASAAAQSPIAQPLESPPSTQVPTDVGVIKEAFPSPAQNRKRSVALIALAVAALGLAVTGGALWLRQGVVSQPRVVSATPQADPGQPVSASAIPPAGTVAGADSAASTVTLAPLPTTAPSASASAKNAPGAVTAHSSSGVPASSAPGTPNGNKPPSTLGAIQLH